MSIGAIVGQPAPAFEAQALVNGEFKKVKLSDYKGKYLILVFYPMDFTFVCPTEIVMFNDHLNEFKTVQCDVVVCSVDSVYTHLAWTNTPRKQGGLGPMNIAMISDITKQMSKDYGILIENGANAGVALRGLFIIDDKGTLRQMTVNDLGVGRSVDETLRLVKAFQFTDKYGEVCPANWHPGNDTVKTDPKLSKEYFAKH